MHPVNPYQSLVSLLSNILEAYTTAFFVVDAKNRQLELAAAQSLSKHLPRDLSIPLEESGILSQVHKVGQTIHLDKLPEISSPLSTTLPFYRAGESHIKGLFAAPVGDGAGILYVDTKYAWGFSDKQRKWIREIADLLHEILKRQECLRQQQDYARILGFWHRLDQAALNGCALNEYCQLLVQESSEFLESEYAFLAFRESDSPHYHLLAATSTMPRGLTGQNFLVKQGLIGWILQNRKPLFIPRLNPDAPDHFLLTSSEGLPHHGTFWGLPAHTSLDHSVVLAFLTRATKEWNSDDRFAISHLMHLFHLILDQSYFQEECEHLQAFDLVTGIANPLVFEQGVEDLLAVSMHNSVPFTLALIQIEPWQALYTKISPKHVRRLQKRFASEMCRMLPSNTLAGQLAENRFGLLFPEMTAQDARPVLSTLADMGRQLFAEKTKRNVLKPYFGMVAFPQDATRSEELWPSVYGRLFEAFQSGAEERRSVSR